MAIGTGMGALIAGLAAGGASAYGSKRASDSATNAARTTAAATDRAMAIEQENETRRRQEYDREEAERKTQWDAQQKILAEDRARAQRLEDEERAYFYAKEARREPYRLASDAALRSAAASIGLDMSGVPSRVPNVFVPGVATRETPLSSRRVTSAASSVMAPTGVPEPFMVDASAGYAPMSEEVLHYRKKPRYV